MTPPESLNFVSITYSDIKTEIEYYLKQQHIKGNILYSVSSPYGQILSVLENLHQLSFLYLKNSINQFDLGLQNSINERVIKNAALLAGHVPGRPISATGTLKLTLKSNAEINTDIPGGKFTIYNKTRIKNITNGLNYLINNGSEKTTYVVTSNFSFFLSVIQGEWVSFTRTGDGSQLQTFNFSESSSKDIENFNVEVLVNGVMWEIKKSLWDLLPDEESCVVRTGFDGGIDVIFGNSGFGKIPEIGSNITVNYIKTDGVNGNILRRTFNDFKFVDYVYDGYGEAIDITKSFDIEIYTDITFGANKESISFTKNILPFTSNNFVLGLPQQYAYELKKLGIFSHVTAYEKTGTIFIMATPNVSLFKDSDSNYFTVDIRSFQLDDYEISKIDKYLKTSGNLQLTRKYRIKSPTLSYYVMNIYIMTYTNSQNESINSQILEKISNYFLNLTRMNRIPKVDLIKELYNITDIHSIDIQFICQKNEDYHKEAYDRYKSKIAKYDTSYETDISISTVIPEYIPTQTIGLDPILGDILFESEEIPIIRGGWKDRNGIYYSDDIDGNGLKSVNIIRKGTVDVKNKTKI
jgi:hypothetical protein